MFTGIIEEIGTIKEFKKNGSSAVIVVECKKILESFNQAPHLNPPPQGGRKQLIEGEIATKIGESISIEGVCQTVTSFSSNSFSAEISSETLFVTTFSKFKTGDKVNLERALMLQSRLGGHIVTGHVDGLAKVKNIKKECEFYNLTFEIEKNLSKYIVKKGSVAINGISLTIADIYSDEFKTAIIPHTFENTTLKYLKTGDYVNIETDILAKYIEKFLSPNNNNVVDENFLKENGFF